MSNPVLSATAIASPNIALIKYWGNLNQELRIPSNSSISMTLGGLETHTTVRFDNHLEEDRLTIDEHLIRDEPLFRTSRHLDHIRKLAGIMAGAEIISTNSFPLAAGIASSASGFAALTLAACQALGLKLDLCSLSRIARLGSGSAARSIFGGFVLLNSGKDHQAAFAQDLAPPSHWALVDLIAIVSRSRKKVGSTMGHSIADTSPLQIARIKDTPRRIELCRRAIIERDFSTLASIVEQDSNMMHAVMLTSTPQLFYWTPGTVAIMRQVRRWRQDGLQVCFTVDAGPNVHCICTESDAQEVSNLLRLMPQTMEVIQAHTGQGAHLIP